MKALTIKQPFADLIVIGDKTMEIRSWRTDYRGPILVHAALKNYPGFGYYQGTNGAIVGSVSIIDCISFEPHHANSACIGWLPGQWAFVLDYPRYIREPIPAKGRLNFWEFSL